MATLTTPIKAALQTGYSSPRFVIKAGDTLPVIRVQIVSTFGAADLPDAASCHVCTDHSAQKDGPRQRPPSSFRRPFATPPAPRQGARRKAEGVLPV